MWCDSVNSVRDPTESLPIFIGLAGANHQADDGADEAELARCYQQLGRNVPVIAMVISSPWDR